MDTFEKLLTWFFEHWGTSRSKVIVWTYTISIFLAVAVHMVVPELSFVILGLCIMSVQLLLEEELSVIEGNFEHERDNFHTISKKVQRLNNDR